MTNKPVRKQPKAVGAVIRDPRVLTVVILVLTLSAYFIVAHMTDVPSGQPQVTGLLTNIQDDKTTHASLDNSGQITGIIAQISLEPARPTVTDNLKVSIKAYDLSEHNVSYQYRWYINGKVEESITGEIFPTNLAKKGDLVSVIVTPLIDGVEAKNYTKTIYCFIHRTPPVLTLKGDTHILKDSMATLQLVGGSQDGGNVTYALEPPLVEGMTVDKDSGTIMWSTVMCKAGTYQITASATDIDGSKIIKTFEVQIGVK